MIPLSTMEFEKALAIVEAINGLMFTTMGLGENYPSVDPETTLQEMLLAAETVTAANKAAATTNGTCTIYVVPDPRLIAAAYTLTHYMTSVSPILAIPGEQKGTLRTIAVTTVTMPTDDDRERIGACEVCNTPIYADDKYERTADGLEICEEHANKLSDVIAQLEDILNTIPWEPGEQPYDTRDEMKRALAQFKADLAANGDRSLAVHHG